MRIITRLRAGFAMLSLAGLVVGLSGAASATGSPQADKAAVIPGCVAATNIEDIVDDSGSMQSSDEIRARAQIIEILAKLPDNAAKQMAAVEFGSSANALFPLLTIGSGLSTIQAGLNGIQADNGGTDYNDGFALAAFQNPKADARIFLSDGEHNSGTYNNGHLIPKVKTYVVALGSFDPTILNKIVGDTGGQLFPVANSSDVLKVAMVLNSRLNCLTDPVTFTDVFKPNGPTLAAASGATAAKKKKKAKGFKHAFRPEGNTASVVISHATAGSVIRGLAWKQGKRRIRATASGGANYFVYQLRGLKKGKVRFEVQAKALAGTTSATTQIQP